MPLAQAMALDVPVLAYAAAAVPETMGGAGVLIDTWEPARVAGLMRRAIEDQGWRAQLLAGQRANLRRFAPDEARARLAAIIRYLRLGERSDLFEWISNAAMESPDTQQET
jgi:glycosyltransferase involved in cell wall biosynthesis